MTSKYCMTSKHTPGPWFVENKNPSEFGLTISADQEFRTTRLEICHIAGYGEDQNSNARLIVAAPDLLNALKRILNAAYGLADEGEAETVHSALKVAHAAITKAEGGK